MKTEHNYIGVANYSETRYELDEIDWIKLHIEELVKECLKPSEEQLRFRQGKCDALFLLEPESDDFSYLCGWHWQTEKMIEENDTFNPKEFTEF